MTCMISSSRSVKVVDGFLGMLLLRCQLIYTLTRTITYLYVDVNGFAKVFFKAVARGRGCDTLASKAAVEIIRITERGYGKACVMHSGSGRRDYRRGPCVGQRIAGGEV